MDVPQQPLHITRIFLGACCYNYKPWVAHDFSATKDASCTHAPDVAQRLQRAAVALLAIQVPRLSDNTTADHLLRSSMGFMCATDICNSQNF